MNRVWVALLTMLVTFTASAQNSVKQNTLVVHADDNSSAVISRHIYGHFSEHLGRCIYGGLWVGENSPIPNTRGIRKDVADALYQLGIPNLRWPGGCFADEYHWKNGIGPKENRASMVNTNWGGVTEDNSFGTHEFMELCEQIKCEPVITGNLGSGSVEEMSQWVEYLNSDNISPVTDMRKKNGRESPWNVKYWSLGNEAWGCGGNMEPDYYFNEAIRYATFCKDYNGKRLYKIACGPSEADYRWTETFMRMWAAKSDWLQASINGLSLHYYTICHTWEKKGSATQFTEKELAQTLYNTLRMEELIKKHAAIMDKYDPKKKMGLIVDEWGNWFDVEPGSNPGFLFQQNTLRDALVAGINLNIFNNYCDRVKMANLAQAVNVLQSVVLTRDEELVLTPTYFVFKMFKPHQEAVKLPITLNAANYTCDTLTMPAVSASASRDSLGKIHISLVNLDPNNVQLITVSIPGFHPAQISGEIITADSVQAYNDFGKKESVRIAPFSGAEMVKNILEVHLPAKSVVMLELQSAPKQK